MPKLTDAMPCIEVVEMVAYIMPIVALFQVFDGLTAVTGGIMRSLGKQVGKISYS